MALHTGSHTHTSLRPKKSTKESKRRPSHTVSQAPNTAQAGPRVIAQHSVQSAATERPNSTSRDGRLPVAATASVAKPCEPQRKVPNVFEFLEKDSEDSEASSSSASSSSESESEESSDEEEQAARAHPQAVAKIQSPTPQSHPTPHPILDSSRSLVKASAQSTASRRAGGTAVPPPAPTAPAPVNKQALPGRRQPPSPKALPTKSRCPTARFPDVSRVDNNHSARDASWVHRGAFPPSPPSSPEESARVQLASRPQHSDAPRVSSGYGLIASQLTRSAAQDQAAFPPLYRRFESVNHRVLLHLQDEIAQMEEDLNTLDEYEEIHRVATAEQQGIKPPPASRRTDVQAQAYSSLHYRRMDLMAALIQKTEQYNTALSAYSKVLQTLPGASEEAITNYRSWMKSHGPIDATEARFLDQTSDLVALTPRLASSAAAAPVYMAIIIASGALLMPLLAFSMIREFPGRLVVVAVIAGAAAAVAANYSSGIEALVDSRDGWRCAAFYFGFMAFAAMFIP
ncbi:Uncharacterized protein PECH_008745 [Penicillium ucsense]|uniref:DUF6594 domain-containing protein n=1 Tax=Penicillium ucsense TaxID=2839758 RepID=A0A8J8VZC9_9EURO|nr:Uncharacterized protein PECM_008358 [Penicillium ucsense]KAF7733957.1 Uncharacterized protein PECH_008745 [Penicillium ucsense]